MKIQDLRSIGWGPFFEQQVSPEVSEGTLCARVSAHHGSQLLLLGEEGEFSLPIQLAHSVRIAAANSHDVKDADAGEDIAVGDWLLLDADDHRAVKRLDRQTLLYRKAAGEKVRPQLIAANIDTIFIVSSCNEEFNLSRIERYLALVLQSGAMPVVVLTKADLCDSVADLRQQTERLHAGLMVETLDARDADQADVLKSWCRPGQTVALVGSSGVGKSTLANALGATTYGDTELATGGIREKDSRGRHTTTARSLHLLPSGGVLVDNPGMRELQLPACEEGMADLFDDIFQLANECRFNDCHHQGDAGCAIEAAVEAGDLDERRFHNFMKLNAEQAHNSRTLAERRQRDREFGKMIKSVLSEKRKRRED